MTPASPNARIAEKLREAADILQAQRANPFRIRAYRQAAERVGALDVEVGDVLAARGIEGLLALPGIGPGIAAAINELVRTGRWSQLFGLAPLAPFEWGILLLFPPVILLLDETRKVWLRRSRQAAS